ncbi:MAG: hypothetical protein A3D37_00325 [Candidatus Zambryskibacteria bacterium RIFCSPHIGHO2_02_FULL_38_22]|nr:MAG: hypothetical protein A3D37_00325 [Candidatus Zambryskibacteria bacterium RIFCSPHIGHO2_02_FULL_38_22]
MNFLREFLRYPTKTGAIVPSSRALAKLIIDTANLSNKKCVVELGSGDGIFTEEIEKHINANCEFFSLEINDKFVDETKRRCPDVTVYHDSAKNIKKYLLQYNREYCDCIISSLPWVAFDKNSQKDLLGVVCDSLEDGGIFLTFAYIHGVFLPSGINFRHLLKDFFKDVEKTEIIWVNMPPAFVYLCRK